MTDYWENHYRNGGTSGNGSRGRFAELKRDLIHAAIEEYEISSILELGSGDGYVANLIEGVKYLGYDPSPAAVALAKKAAPQHQFVVARHPHSPWEAHLSMDVIRHIMDDETLADYLGALFSAERVVMIWSSDVDKYWSPQELEHKFTDDVPEGWDLVTRSPVPGINTEWFVYLRA